jgi:hypothetical protein
VLRFAHSHIHSQEQTMQYLFATLTVVTFFPLVGVVVLLFIKP